MIAYVILAFVVLGVVLAYVLKFRFSGKGYNKFIAGVVVLFNGFCGFFYIELTQNECVLFFECFPGLIKNNLIVEIVAVAAIFLHCLAIPTEWEPWRLFRLRRKVR